KGINVIPEIMIPLVALEGELTVLKDDAIREIERVFKVKGKTIKYKIGTMIELPRAAIMAGSIAPHAEFFSFGTNDLTQTTFGLSRDDAGKFLPEYVTKGLLPNDPFVSIDQDGVGFLMKHAVSEGRKANPNMHFGICGEHGGESKSIEFCHKIGLDYVSCSPYRVPIARLSAAQAAIRNSK
ncbi:MAG: putative PEP-binding protein, partial [Bacteriovorax sp.]|nr:putative PEP-binding protein [Bacteriovorax sp.]